MPTEPGDGGFRTVESVAMALDVLQAVRSLERARLTDVAEHAGRSKSGVYRHLETLRERGFVSKTGAEYSLGHRFIDYSEQTKRTHIVNFDDAKRELTQLALDTGEFVQAMIETQGRGVYVLKVGGTEAIGSDYAVGERQYLHASAAGKAILAEVPADRVDAIVETHGLQSMTEYTVTDRRSLREELDRIGTRGFALSDEETAVGIRAVGTALVDQRGDVLGSISISGPVSRFEGDYFRSELPKRIVEVTNIIEIRGNYHA